MLSHHYFISLLSFPFRWVVNKCLNEKDYFVKIDNIIATQVMTLHRGKGFEFSKVSWIIKCLKGLKENIISLELNIFTFDDPINLFLEKSQILNIFSNLKRLKVNVYQNHDLEMITELMKHVSTLEDIYICSGNRVNETIWVQFCEEYKKHPDISITIYEMQSHGHYMNLLVCVYMLNLIETMDFNFAGTFEAEHGRYYMYPESNCSIMEERRKTKTFSHENIMKCIVTCGEIAVFGFLFSIYIFL